jgi:hypothetical protein
LKPQTRRPPMPPPPPPPPLPPPQRRSPTTPPPRYARCTSTATSFPGHVLLGSIRVPIR